MGGGEIGKRLKFVMDVTEAARLQERRHREWYSEQDDFRFRILVVAIDHDVVLTAYLSGVSSDHV